MDLYSRMLNITGNNNINELVDSINEVKCQLNNLITEQTCKIYNGMLYDELVKRHVPANLVNTSDLGLDYEHVFVLVSEMDNYLIADLTFAQFGNHNPIFNNLITNGYMSANKDSLNQYLKVIDVNLDKEYDIDNLIVNYRRK